MDAGGQNDYVAKQLAERGLDVDDMVDALIRLIDEPGDLVRSTQIASHMLAQISTRNRPEAAT